MIMQEMFYDYKRKAYRVLDAVGQNDWQLYLLQSSDGRYFIFNTANAELTSSAKPLRSVFNRYKASEMYNIPQFAQEIQNEDLLIYESQKYDVLAYDVQKRQGIETAERITRAKANGWQELNADNAEIGIEGKTLNILVDGKQFAIKARSADVDFSSMPEEEVKSFVSQWITTYNNTVGDLANAQTYAEGSVLSARQVAQWVKEGKGTSDYLTEKLVENLDINDKYDGYQGDRAFFMVQAILKHMEKNKIPYLSDAKLMGDCSSLDYDVYNVVRQHYIYSEDYRAEEIIADLEIKTLQLLDTKGVLPLNAATPEDREYTATVDIPNSDGIDLKAKKYINKTIGAESYDIIVGSKYPYFDVGKRIIGCCNQKTLDIILGKETGANRTGIKLNATEQNSPALEDDGKPVSKNQMQM